VSGLWNIIVHIYAFSAAVPFLWFFVLWIGVYLWRRDGKQATKLAMDVTTLLLIGSVSVMFAQFFDSNFGFFLILLFFLIGYGLLGNLQFRRRGKMDHKKIIRILWRLGFLGLSAVYLVFLLIGLAVSIVSA